MKLRSIGLALALTSITCLSHAQEMDDDGFVAIFDGETLDCWDGDATYWRVEFGSLVGEVTPETILTRNSFIIWRGGTVDDFELKVEYRVTDEGNSGINYRSIQLTDAPWSLAGYQADIDGPDHDKRLPRRRYTGQAYEERGRRFLAWRGEMVHIDSAGVVNVIGSLGNRDSLEAFINSEGWNQYHIIARGNLLTHIVNSRVMAVVIDDDIENRRMKAYLAFRYTPANPTKLSTEIFDLKNCSTRTILQNLVIQHMTIPASY